ncbi:hypothetical protein M8J77_014917 [Diaphorina citri]|nr:hypothetical protein M8J77_014917 [Diaphorina citri]
MPRIQFDSRLISNEEGSHVNLLVRINNISNSKLPLYLPTNQKQDYQTLCVSEGLAQDLHQTSGESPRMSNINNRTCNTNKPAKKITYTIKPEFNV